MLSYVQDGTPTTEVQATHTILLQLTGAVRHDALKQVRVRVRVCVREQVKTGEGAG